MQDKWYEYKEPVDLQLSWGKKKCYKCGFIKYLKYFRKDHRIKSGRTNLCTKCNNAITREKYKAGLIKKRTKTQKHKEDSLNYYYRNRERIKARYRAYYRKKKLLFFKSKTSESKNKS